MSQQEKEQQVAALRTRRPWTASDARFVLETYKSSGETLAEFARRMKLVPQRLQWWQKRLGRPASEGSAVAAPAYTSEGSAIAAPTFTSEGSAAPTFVPVVVRPAPADRAPGEVAAVLVSGEVRVEVREMDERSAAWVAAVARALQEVRP